MAPASARGSAWPTSGKGRGSALPGGGRSRATKVMGGLSASSCTGVARSASARATPGRACTARTSAGSRKRLSAGPLPAARTYSGAGNTLSSQALTESRKLATITVRATDNARLATTPLSATAAVSRWRWARLRASSHRGLCAQRRTSVGSSAFTAQGRAAMPPNSNKATDA